MLFTLYSAVVVVAANGLFQRDTCATGLVQCQPSGAKSDTPGPIGDALSSLYIDLLETVGKTSTKSRRELQQLTGLLAVRAASSPVCCQESTQCLLLVDYDVPFCYDKFTTNFFLSDGSYGNVVYGNYTDADGSTANLLTGDYQLKNGSTGNIYASNTSAKPNTSTLTVPTQFTGTGVGSAIPVTALGGIAQVETTTLTGSNGSPTATVTTTVIQSAATAGTTKKGDAAMPIPRPPAIAGAALVAFLSFAVFCL
jgi:hypothetical protein